MKYGFGMLCWSAILKYGLLKYCFGVLYGVVLECCFKVLCEVKSQKEGKSCVCVQPSAYMNLLSFTGL